MKYISIQLQPEREKSLDTNFVITILEKNGYEVEVDKDENNGKYINLNIKTNNLNETWTEIKNNILKDPIVSNSSIVVCEGSRGWDNYLLLHHFDKAEVLDELSNH